MDSNLENHLDSDLLRKHGLIVPEDYSTAEPALAHAPKGKLQRLTLLLFDQLIIHWLVNDSYTMLAYNIIHVSSCGECLHSAYSIHTVHSQPSYCLTIQHHLLVLKDT